MTFTLHVDAARWRSHQARTRDDVRTAIAGPSSAGDLVPVAKGNGYGVGNVRLATEAQRLGLTRLAVGTVFEVAEVAEAYDGDILVLTPFEPADPVAGAAWVEVAHAPYADRVVRTVSSRAAWDVVADGPGPVRLVLEALTSIGRFGLEPSALRAILGSDTALDALLAGRIRLEGLALHEPIAQPHVDRRYVAGSRWHDADVAPLAPAGASPRVDEVLSAGLAWLQLVADLSERIAARGDDEALTEITEAAALWVSHLDDAELRTVRASLPDIALYPRIGTRLWLGDRGALRARGTVLAVHEVTKGQASGYRQRRASRAGAVVVVGGGTAHGVALEAPSAVSTLRQRAVAAGSGVLEGAGRALSPFVIGGAQRWFAETPHMHVSLVRVPRGIALPVVGDELDVDVRLTTIHPDRVLGVD
jgi:hypothetical protein